MGDYQPGAIYASNGYVLAGSFSLGPGNSAHVFDPAHQQYRDILFSSLAEIRVRLVTIRPEESQPPASDIQRFRAEYGFDFVLKAGETLKAELGEPIVIHVTTDRGDATPAEAAPGLPQRRPGEPGAEPNAERTILLAPYQIGEPGQPPEEIAHVTRVAFGERARAQAAAEIEARPRRPSVAVLPAGRTSPISEMNYWSLYIIVFFTFSQLLLLGFVLTLAYKLEKLMRNVQEMSRDAGKFLRMGVNYFKSQK